MSLRFLGLFAALLFSLAGCGDGPFLGIGGRSIAPEELRSAVSDPALRRFYQMRNWEAAWTDDRARALETALGEAQRHALDPGEFTAPDEADQIRRELALTRTALRYAQALAYGVVDPRSLWDIYTIPRNRLDLGAGLHQALESGQLEQWLAGLAPQDPEYRTLSEAYVSYRRRAAQTPLVTVPAGETIEVGDGDPRVQRIVAALRAQGYLGPAPAPSNTQRRPAEPAPADRYTPEIAAAVRRLQEDYGIEPDGIVSSDTLEALNTGISERTRILAANLERRRWLDRGPPRTRIDVNTAAANLAYWRDGRRVLIERVVVGQPEWETPQLGSPLRRLVINPPWNVPESIAETEILPRGAGYMARNNMRFENGRIVQAPGPESALGLVKFDLDNPHAIYLHDTPAKALFETNDRHASHGCVRVRNAVGFARLLAGEHGKLEEFDRELAAGEESSIELREPIPVRLLYHTAFLENGRVQFSPDPYGWDDRLARALGLGIQVRRRVQPRAIGDVGP